MFSKFDVPKWMKEICCALITLLVYVFVGINRSYITFLFHQLDNDNSLIIINDEQKSWIASFITLLSPIGCLISGIIMDMYGRKLFVQLVFIPFVVSWVIITFATDITMLYIGMMVQSVGTGMSFCTATYISEISSANHRGVLLSTIEINYAIGIVLCNLLMFNFQWNSVALVFVIISVFAFFMTFLLPESPMWLYSKGQKEKSIKILKSLRCAEQMTIDSEVQDMDKACQTKPKMSFFNTLMYCIKAWRPFLIVTGLFILMQHTGYPMMVSFTIMIIDRLEIPYESAKITIIYSVVSFMASIVTLYSMHKFGRKVILTISAFGMAISMAVVVVYEELFSYEKQKPVAWLVPLALFFYTFICTNGVLPISFVLGGELFPHEVRGTLNGIYGAFGYIYWILLFKIFPWFLIAFGIKITLWSFVFFGVIVALFGLFILPETKGISLNEVQKRYFQKNEKELA